MKKLLTVFLAAVMVLAFSATAFASSGSKNVDIAYRGININIDEAELIPRDVNGASTEPFIIDGTTYLPVRAVANGLGLSVDWDSNTNTVILTSGGRIDYGYGKAAATTGKKNVKLTYRDIKIKIDGQEITPKDANGKVVEPFIISGTTYLPIRAVGSALGAIVNWYPKTDTVDLRQYALAEYTSTSAEGAYSCTMKYDARGNLIKVAYSNGDYYSYEYNENNDEIVSEYFFSFYGYSVKSRSESTYNSNGQLVSTKTVKDETDENGKITKSTTNTTYTYDAKGNLIKGISTGDEYENYKGENVFTYDANGNCLTETWVNTYNADGIAYKDLSEYKYTYDANNNVTIENITYAYYEDGEEVSKDVYETIYTYDSMGNILTEYEILTSYEMGEELGSDIYDYKYTYNERGQELNRTFKHTYTTDGESEVSYNDRNYTYNEYGDCLTHDYKAINSIGESNIVHRDYQYDAIGRQMKTVSAETDYDGTYEGYTAIYTYGANGRDYTIDYTYDDGSKERSSYKYILLAK